MSSLKDLARECGVSVATVSKALNGQSDISAATRDRVREAARRMGYVPNMAARAMKTNRTYNLGVLFVDERQSGLAHEYFSAVLDSFKVQVEKLGYDITFVNRNLGGRTMTYLEHCHYRGVDGAVIACVDFNDPQVVELVNSDVPVVTILPADGIDPQAAALIEPFAISAHAVRRAAIAPGEQVLVVGAGPIGLGAAAIAKADGAQVVVADTSPARREHVATRLELPVLDPSAEDFDAQLRAQFGGSLAQKVIDATGNQHAMNNTVNLIRHGGTVVFVGLFKGELQFSDPEFHKKETTMMGSRNATPEDFAKVGRLMAEGKITADMMLTHRYPFATLAETYERDVINNRELIKGVITF